MTRKIVVEPQHVLHPSWCDPARCTATAADGMGGAHVGTRVTVPAAPGYSLAMSACLYQAHAPWPTETFIDLELTGLADRHRPASGSARVPVSVAHQLGLALLGLAADASDEGVSA